MTTTIISDLSAGGRLRKQGSRGEGVLFVREELSLMLDRYKTINDALIGEDAVKNAADRYLPIPSYVESASTNDSRYQAYLKRSVYYNVCQPTRDALVGQIFLRPPVIELPDVLSAIENDVNGEGISLTRLISKTADYVLPFGRAGLLADFPRRDDDVSVGELRDGLVRPIIRLFEPWSIRNWHYEYVGSVRRLVLLVLDEKYEKQSEDNDFHRETAIRQRVYRLVNGEVTVQLYEEDQQPQQAYTIQNSEGKPMTEIPFQFIGSENNDEEIDEPPFYGLATLNLAHYRNSADYEESAFIVGQPTPVYTGLTEDWVANYFEGGKMPFGSRASVPLPEKATAQLLQAEPNTLAYEAMTHKEDQMLAIGAKILNPDRKVERKEVEIEIDAASQKSVLMTIKDNIEDAYIKILNKALMFVTTSGEVKLKLNDNFDLTSMSPEDLQQLMATWQGGGIDFDELRENLRRSGMATKPTDQARKGVIEDKALKEAVLPKPPETGSNNNG